jgi:hypothetical protein
MTPDQIEIPQTQDRPRKRRRQDEEDEDDGTHEEPQRLTSGIIYESTQSSTSGPFSEPTQLKAEAFLAMWATITDVQQRRLSIPNHSGFTQSPLHENISIVVCEIAATHMGLNVETSKKIGINIGIDLNELLRVYRDLLQACIELSQQNKRRCDSSPAGVNQESRSQMEVMRSIISGSISVLLLQMDSPLYLSQKKIRRKEKELERREREVKKREIEVAGREENEMLLRPLPEI